MQGRDADRLLAALTQNGYRATQINSAGGFLRESNVTVLIGVNDDQVPDILRILKQNCYTRTQYMNPLMPVMEPGASIVNTASIQAKNPSASLLAYATTKGGIVTFSKALSAECIEKGIRVNVVAPGPVWTPLVVATSDPEANSTFGQQAPIGRPAQPAELAPAFVFLASPESSYITGEVIAVTGGEFFS